MREMATVIIVASGTASVMMSSVQMLPHVQRSRRAVKALPAETP
jgi:hypothetical protein